VEETMESAYLAAARWAMSDRDAPEAMRWLDGLRHGAARRMLALRMRLKAARLNQQHASALETARLLTKHGAFSDTAGQSLLRELAVASLNDAHGMRWKTRSAPNPRWCYMLHNACSNSAAKPLP
jgi:HemY protein